MSECSDSPQLAAAATPHRAGLGFMLAMLAVLLGGILLLNAGVLETSYAGIGFLLLIPFAIGGLVTGAGLRLYTSAGCIFAPLVVFAITFPLVYFGLGEGLVCIAMAMPFWLAAGLGGGLATWLIHRRQHRAGTAGEAARLQAAAFVALPFAVLWAEEAAPPAWEERSVVRAVVVDADAATVWPLLASIPDVRGDEGLATFTHDVVGVPRPSEARLVRRADGLVREGRWGKAIRFEERVTAIVPGRRIRWDFAFPDTSVQDYTDRHISPDGPLLKIARGGYALEPLGPGRVRVTLSTTYRMRSRLDWYAALWGEILLGDIEDNVLAIIRTRAENAARNAD
ncbi:MAG: hypothetical protein GC147_13790 [Porphyrobacter sp.]|nr:hypothetical protein [Porphyrobacter sp.]